MKLKASQWLHKSKVTGCSVAIVAPCTAMRTALDIHALTEYASSTQHTRYSQHRKLIHHEISMIQPTTHFGDSPCTCARKQQHQTVQSCSSVNSKESILTSLKNISYGNIFAQILMLKNIMRGAR